MVIIISNLSLERNQLKQTLKELIIELFSENKEEFSALFTEIIEDIALSKAIEEGEKTELTDRETIFAILNQEQ
ncbi:MAG: hypothetical protein ACKPH9_10130 [Dolichospermum sp.]